MSASRPDTRSRQLTRWLLVIAWMTFIFLLSSRSGLRVSEDASVDRPIRALAHMGVFAMLCGLVLYALCGLNLPTLIRAVLAVVVTVVYAISDEWHQTMVPDRTGRAEDVVIDLLGALVGLVAATVVLRWAAGRRPAGGSGPRAEGPSGEARLPGDEHDT